MAHHSIVVYCEDSSLRCDVSDHLRLDGHSVYVAEAKEQFLWALTERSPAAVVLGGTPTLSATLALLRELRDATCGGDRDVPALVLSAESDEFCELAALEAGADDFQRSSVSYLVLRARLAALIARSQITRQPRRLTVGALHVDAERREATYGSKRLALSKLEFALLHRLACEPERVVSRQELLCDIWGYPTDAGARTRTVDAHAARVRRKLIQAGACSAIENRRGVGYRLGALGLG